MFTTPCFIRKNTHELRIKLDELGYEIMYGYNIKGIYTSAELGVFFIPVSDDLPELSIDKIEKFNKLIDCGENEELFLAIAALNDDTDRFQWFTDGNKWIRCRKDSIITHVVCLRDNADLGKIHKATVEELIEHFRKYSKEDTAVVVE